MKVLIVDDDLAIQRMVTRMLEERQHQVVASNTPYGVSALIIRHAPDLALLDVRMPGLTGPQLAELINGLPLTARPALVLWSALDEDSLRELGRSTGLPYISKTRGPLHIVDEIERLAAMPPAQRQRKVTRP